jgi:hypothetical protein
VRCVRWLLAASACMCWSLLGSRGDPLGGRPSQARMARRAGVQCGSAGEPVVRSLCSCGVRSGYKIDPVLLVWRHGKSNRKGQRSCAGGVWAPQLSLLPATVHLLPLAV